MAFVIRSVNRSPGGTDAFARMPSISAIFRRSAPLQMRLSSSSVESALQRGRLSTRLPNPLVSIAARGSITRPRARRPATRARDSPAQKTQAHPHAQTAVTINPISMKNTARFEDCLAGSFIDCPRSGAPTVPEAVLQLSPKRCSVRYLFFAGSTLRGNRTAQPQLFGV